MQAAFDFMLSYPAIPIMVLLIAGVIGWHMWDFRIRPLFIPKAEIDAVVDGLIAKYGPRAEEVAYGEEEGAWYRSDTFEQGKWRRVRRELWRRYRVGEWE